ncbi:MAG TPA: HAD-IB family phosphatase [Patescibacteria group bacterium]
MKINDILLIDFDSTIVTVESLDILASIVLKDRLDRDEIVEKIQEITKLGMEGKITFPQSLETRLKLFAPNKKHIDELAEFLNTRITPSFKRNKKFLKDNAENIYILSGGFKEYMTPVLKSFGILEDHILGNNFFFDEKGNFVGHDKENVLAKDKGKVNKIKEMKFTGEVYMVGDGYTDYEIKEAGLAKKFIAFIENVEREVVVKNADIIAKNFEEVLINL